MSVREQPPAQPPAQEGKPVLLFFSSNTSGPSRRVEGFLAQVLQRRHNHDTLTLRWIECESCPDLVERYAVVRPPTLILLDGTNVRARLEAPRGCVEIQTMLAQWLR